MANVPCKRLGKTDYSSLALRYSAALRSLLRTGLLECEDSIHQSGYPNSSIKLSANNFIPRWSGWLMALSKRVV